MKVYLNAVDVTLLLEVGASPQDCFINHRFSKASLKRLLVSELVEVETRRCSPWYSAVRSPVFNSATEQRLFWESWAKVKRSLHWQPRSEVHARLTRAGQVWVDDYKNRGLYEP